MSVGDGGTEAEFGGGDLAKLPTLSISVNAVPDGVELNVPEGLVVPGTEEMPIAMDIRGRLKDEAEERRLSLRFLLRQQLCQVQ